MKILKIMMMMVLISVRLEVQCNYYLIDMASELCCFVNFVLTE